MVDIYEIAEQLRTQDNAITKEPVFLVQQRQRIYGVENADTFAWMDEEFEEADDETSAILDVRHAETGATRSGGYTRLGVTDEWVYVAAFLTRAGAERYIKQNAHHLTEPRIFVDSGYGNEEWIALRAFLKGLARGAA